MATEFDVHARLRAGLRDMLDGEHGPHPIWRDSPAARTVAERGRRRRGTGPLRALAIAAVLVLGAAGVAVVGSWLADRRDVTPSPQPTVPILAADCAEWQRRAATVASGWDVAGPQPTSPAGAGLIATVSEGRSEVNNVLVGSDPVIGLLDPVTGSYCAVLTRSDADSIYPGPTWSEQGHAMAFVAAPAPGWGEDWA